jgi:hypothetical protein
MGENGDCSDHPPRIRDRLHVPVPLQRCLRATARGAVSHATGVWLNKWVLISKFLCLGMPLEGLHREVELMCFDAGPFCWSEEEGRAVLGLPKDLA